MILVVGATGVLGFEVCRRLRARQLPVRALVRAGSPRERALVDLGVEIAHGDLRAPASLAAACRGADTVISTATAMGSSDRSLTLRAVDHDGQLALVAAATAAGVRHFVFTSVSPRLQPSAPLVRYKREVERALRASGMRWTILQPNAFMDIWLGEKLGWDHRAGRATIMGPGTAPLSWIAVADVAEYAVRAVDDTRLHDKDLPLGGPDALSPNEALRVFEEVSGRRYRVMRVPTVMLRVLGPVAALVNEQIASGMGLGAQTAGGDVTDSPLQRAVGVPLTTLRDYATRTVASVSAPRSA